MNRKLEDKLRAELAAGRWARDVIAEMLGRGEIASAKQAHRTLEKWADSGEYDYGVALDLGWLVKREAETKKPGG